MGDQRLPRRPGAGALIPRESAAPDLAQVAARLAAAGCIAAEEEAAELAAAADGDPGALEDLVARRSHGEPVAWLTGTATFCGLALAVTPGVYVPRWQTEPLARRAASLLPPGGVAADLCTGAGAVAAHLTAAVPTARVVATELDPGAAACARRNGVEVFEGSLTEPLPAVLRRRIDVMTAVVPYVPTGALRLLPRDVQAFEPAMALDGGVDGTDVLAAVVRQSVAWLADGGWLLLELGGDQVAPLGQLLRARGFGDVEVTVDEDGDVRAISARWTPPPAT